MSKIRLCELSKKEVINCCDCKKLGYIDDLIIDDCKGCIEALVVPEGGKWCNFLEMEQSISYHFPASKESALIYSGRDT